METEVVVLIQPVQPVSVTLKIGENKYECQMLSLTEEQLELSGQNYLEKGCQVFFMGKYFRGAARINEIEFAQYCFTYTLDIENIQFQPGLLINTRL